MNLKITGNRSRDNAVFIDVADGDMRGTLRIVNASRELIAALIAGVSVAVRDGAGPVDAVRQAEAQRRREIDEVIADWKRRQTPTT